MIENYVDNFWFINIPNNCSNSLVQDKVYKLIDNIIQTQKIPTIYDEIHNSFNETNKSPGALNKEQHAS